MLVQWLVGMACFERKVLAGKIQRAGFYENFIYFSILKVILFIKKN